MHLIHPSESCHEVVRTQVRKQPDENAHSPKWTDSGGHKSPPPVQRHITFWTEIAEFNFLVLQKKKSDWKPSPTLLFGMRTQVTSMMACAD
jgi:hypothetical protein